MEMAQQIENWNIRANHTERMFIVRMKANETRRVEPKSRSFCCHPSKAWHDEQSSSTSWWGNRGITLAAGCCDAMILFWYIFSFHLRDIGTLCCLTNVKNICPNYKNKMDNLHEFFARPYRGSWTMHAVFAPRVSTLLTMIETPR